MKIWSHVYEGMKEFGLSHINYLCTYDLYGPMRNGFDAGRYLCGEVGGELALEI